MRHLIALSLGVVIGTVGTWLVRGSSQPPISSDNSSSDEHETQRSPEEAHRALWEHFTRERRDVDWAEGVEDALAREVSAVSSVDRDVSVECRSRICKVDITFPSFEEARTHFADYLHATYSLNCYRSTLVPRPSMDTENASRLYVMSMFISCDDTSIRFGQEGEEGG